MTASQVSDYIDVATLLYNLPNPQLALGGRAYDADWVGNTLQAKHTQPRIPNRKS